nr:hypothetical protein [Pigmentiphaga sp. NML030171]
MEIDTMAVTTPCLSMSSSDLRGDHLSNMSAGAPGDESTTPSRAAAR